MASLKDVAKLANVSLMTVSRALNSPERLKPETLARVQAAIEQTNYVPDLSAKKIRGAHATPNTIGVLALDTVTTPFSVEITLSIEETARAHGWNSFVVNMFSDDSPETIVDLLLSHRPDGIIYTTMGLRQVPLPAKLLTLPCVLANCESLHDPVASYIPDDEQGQYTAVQELLAAGDPPPLCPAQSRPRGSVFPFFSFFSYTFAGPVNLRMLSSPPAVLTMQPFSAKLP